MWAINCSLSNIAIRESDRPGSDVSCSWRVARRTTVNRAAAEELKVMKYYSKRLLFAIELSSGISWAWEGDRLCGVCALLGALCSTRVRAAQSSSRLSAQD